MIVGSSGSSTRKMELPSIAVVARAMAEVAPEATITTMIGMRATFKKALSAKRAVRLSLEEVLLRRA
jgi:hypothetical protein